MESRPFHVAVVGGGLVGSLAAIFLAKRGWQVEVFELRSDSRNEPLDTGRSINLALSERGIAALAAAGVEEDILKTLLPMKGRMIHEPTGKLSSQAYGVYGECINSADRKMMNDHLLSSAERLPNVKIHFERSLRQCDFDKGEIVFEGPKGVTETRQFDFILGADGAYSKMRQQLMRKTRMSFSQQYIDHGWCQLTIPPTPTGEFAIDPHHLHIWPRHTFMMIALPNRDKSFTATLFMPWEKYDSITNEKELLAFFEATFPDAVPLIGRDALVKEYFANPKGPLMTVKCHPYHIKNKALIIGDAAHAMVPFYGQGMNCGFEDVLVLNSLFDDTFGKSKHPSPMQMAKALRKYSETRHDDVVAMCDLALHNYIEMRSSVVTASYLIRKRIESMLYKMMPSVVIPLYTMVSFSRIPYSQVIKRWKRQTFWLSLSAYTTMAAVAGATVFGVLRWTGGRALLWGSRQ